MPGEAARLTILTMPQPKFAEGDNRPSSAKDVTDRHDFAKRLYVDANQRGDEVVKLLTDKITIKRDRADIGGDVQVTQPVLARAIIERLRQMLQVDASKTFRVIPLREGDKELAACSKLERALSGYERRIRYESKRNFDRDAAWWYLTRGVCYYEARFRPDYIARGLCPYETIVDDPSTIFPVRGRTGILWYTKEYDMYALEVRRLFDELGDKILDSDWLVDIDDDNAKVKVIEFWDDEYYAAVMDDSHLVLSNRPNYGFVPLAEGMCMDTPLSSMEWAYDSVIGPVIEHIKQIYILASKMATGVNLFFYPHIFYESMHGTPVVFDPNNPGEPQAKSPGSKFEILNPQVNAPVLQQLMAFFKNDINLMTLPETAWGSEPQSLQSGFAVAQVLSQVASAVQDRVPNLASAMAWHRGNILRLVDKYGNADEAALEVPADMELD